jgi:transcriptional regulator with GAF, ATPase, and Fis domain
VASWEELAIGLADMARRLLAEPGVEATLSAIVEHAVELVDGCEAAGIMTVRRGQVQTLAATDDVARASGHLQGELGEGPCFDAIRNREQIYRIHDLTTAEDRWPRFAREARHLGVGSMMGFLLFTTGEDNLGALDLFSSKPKTFTERSERVGWVLASHAAVALASSRHTENVDRALGSSRAIGEAIGILMSRYRETEAQAFNRLVRVSQTTNTKVRDLAQEIIRIGEIPHHRSGSDHSSA